MKKDAPRIMEEARRRFMGNPRKARDWMAGKIEDESPPAEAANSFRSNNHA